MEYVLLVFISFFVLTFIWGLLGFGVGPTGQYCLIKNETVVLRGFYFFLSGCMVSWGIFIGFGASIVYSKAVTFICSLL